MDVKGTVDVSSYLLFEATGDSEALSDPIMDDSSIAYQIAISDDDDALSCSYDASGTCNVGEVHEYESDDELDDEKKEEKEVCVYGTSYCEDDDDEMQEHHKSSESVDSGPETVDEMEKNRRFWEACLAS